MSNDDSVSSSKYFPNEKRISFVNQTDQKKEAGQSNKSKYGGNGKNRKLMGLESLLDTKGTDKS